MTRYILKHKIPFFCMGFLCFVTITIMSIEKGHGYLMPTEQLIDLMVKQFVHFKTLTILQSTQQISYWDDEGEDVYEEKIWLKAPDLFYSKPIGELNNQKKRPDMTFHRVLLANEDSQSLQQLLIERGIDLNLVALTRIDGIIAYRIGDEAPETPKMLIEKERFLPLLLVYKSYNLSKEDIITVRFKDYQQVDQGWYPFEIEVSYGNELKETLMIRSIQANGPIEVTTLYPLRFGTPPDQIQRETEDVNDMDEERLKKIIKQFEEKYQ